MTELLRTLRHVSNCFQAWEVLEKNALRGEWAVLPGHCIYGHLVQDAAPICAGFCLSSRLGSLWRVTTTVVLIFYGSPSGAAMAHCREIVRYAVPTKRFTLGQIMIYLLMI